MPYNQFPEEQPRCRRCSHRRIFHTRGIARGGNHNPGVTEEIFVPCSLRVDGIHACGCRYYEPMI